MQRIKYFFVMALVMFLTINPSAHALDSEAEKLAKVLFELQNTNAFWLGYGLSMTNELTFILNKKGLPEAATKQLYAHIINQYPDVSKIKKVYIEIYTTNYSKDELQELVKIYRLPAIAKGSIKPEYCLGKVHANCLEYGLSIQESLLNVQYTPDEQKVRDNLLFKPIVKKLVHLNIEAYNSIRSDLLAEYQIQARYIVDKFVLDLFNSEVPPESRVL